MKYCENCGAQNEDQDLFCGSCGQALSSNESENSEGKHFTSMDSRKCLACGHDLAEGEMFCPECGASVQDEKQQSSEKAEIYSNLYCPECGEIVDEDELFCPHCGASTSNASLEEKIIPKHKPAAAAFRQASEAEEVRPQKPRKKMKTRTKVLLIVLFVVLLIAGGSYAYGKYYYSYDNQMQRIKDMVKEKDAKGLLKVSTTDDVNYTLNEKALKSYFGYFSGDQKELFAQLVRDVADAPSKIQDFTIEKRGKKFFLFDEYQCVFQPVYVKVKTNQKGMDLKLDDQDQGKTDSADASVTWGPLTPGKYHVSGTLDGETTETEVDLLRYGKSLSEEDFHVNLIIEKISFKVKSNLGDADVLIDNKKIGKTNTDGEYEVKNQIWHQGMTVHVAKTLNDKKTIKTKEVEIEEGRYPADDYESDSYASTITLDFEDILTKEQVQQGLSQFYLDVTSFTAEHSTYSGLEKEKFAKNFTGGKNNAEYKDFDGFITATRKSKGKLYIQGTPTVEKVTLTGENTYTVQYLLEYRTVYSGFDKKDVVELFRYKKGTFVYLPEESELLIDNLGGKQNFEVVSRN